MNTGKQINAMVAVLFMVLIAIGAYTIWDPFRSKNAEGEQLAKTADFGAQTFERNCRLCHGDRGEGPPTSGRLDVALPLNTDVLQGIADGVYDPAKKAAAFKLVTNTIMCGRVGKAMPTWGASQGGTLNNEQIRQLAVLITEGRWDLTTEHADATDALFTHNAKVNVDGGTLAADATDLVVSNAGAFSLGQYVRIGTERLRVLPKEILVDRGVDGTTAADQNRGVQLLVNGQPVIRNPSPTLRNGSIVPRGGSAEALAESITKDATALPVGDNSGFAVGDVIQLGDEHVRVTGFTTGIPSTGVSLAKSIGREPKKLLVTGVGEVEQGELVRLESEPMTVQDIGEAGTGIKLDQDVSAGSDAVSVSDPRFLRKGYQFRLGDEWLQVVNPVDTGQTVAEGIGRAQSTLLVSGTEGIEKGMIIRVDGELLKVTDIVKPARVQLSRGDDGTAKVAHDAGTALTKAIQQKEGQPAQDTSTGQAVLEVLSADGTVMSITGTAKINVGDKYKLGDETVTVKAVDPALLRIQRGVQKTSVEEHGRRAPIFAGNELAVTRGVNNTSAAAHQSGDEAILTQIQVKRAVGVKPAEHAKNTEIFIGNHLTVERGVKDTQAGEHKNGDLVRNFPTAPDGPAITGMGGLNVCGQNGPLEAATTGPPGPTPTAVIGATTVKVALKEFSVTPDVTSVAAGAVSFDVSNIGAGLHNFRVIQTNLAADKLPLSGNHVDETAVNVAAHSNGNIAANASQVISADLQPGKYVLICNVPAHYTTGMHVAFEVTAP